MGPGGVEALPQSRRATADRIAVGGMPLWESFYPAWAHWGPPSLNHHFWGDISAWFIKAVAGISVAPVGGEPVCEIKPAFVTALEDASAYHVTPAGKITSAWRREGDEIILTVEIPEGMGGRMTLREGYAFSDGEGEKPAVSGSYRVVCKK